ncbi:MAG: hypothetical protein ABIO04_05585 [Ferruginibacter sp.]
MQKIILIICMLISVSVYAQVPEDALRYSWFSQNGTARNMAIGGAMGSLGGDITATFINPAGIGFYKTGEVVITPSFLLNDNKANYRDNITSGKKNGFNFGPTGIILGSVSRRRPENSSAFSFAINQSANFNNTIRYNALNNYSSFSEQFAEEFAKSGYNINDALNTLSPLPYSSALGLYTYLIDTVTINGETVVRGAPEYLLDSGMAVRQDMYKKTGGGLYDFSFAFAGNNKDKFLWGISLGVPLVHYSSNTTFTESDTSTNAFNRFESFTYHDEFISNGIGFNLKLGAIFKPAEYFRLGLAVHTPTYMVLTETRTSNLTTNTETPTGAVQSLSISSREFTNNQEGETHYTQTSPWKAILSASYVFREIENVKKQRGFITADIEYVHHRGTRFRSDAEEQVDRDRDKPYYKALNNVVKDTYKGAFNFKVGGELKFNTIMGRLGFAYYGKPYKDDEFKANQMLLSGGLGYRNKGFFIDVTYVHKIIKDVSFPYRLEDRANTFATLKQKQGNIVATVGFKF